VGRRTCSYLLDDGSMLIRAILTVGLWRATRTTRWEDWLAIEKPAPGMKSTAEKDVRREIRRKKVQQAAVGAGVATAVAAIWYLSPLLSWHVRHS
jgi:hypothetical protein